MKNRKSIYYIIVGLITLCFSGNGYAEKAETAETAQKKITETTKVQINSSYGNLPLYFIKNNGQVDEKVKFFEKGNGHATFFTTEGVYLSLTRKKAATATNKAKEAKLAKAEKLSHEMVRLTPVGGNKSPTIIAEGLQAGKVNYFIGNDKSRWHSNVPTYSKVVYKEVYDGIDIKYYGNNKKLEYDVVVKPGADPSQVLFAYDGIEGLSVTTDGELEISLKDGKIFQNKPYIYQDIGGKRVLVEGSFTLKEKILQDTQSQNLKNVISTDANRFEYGFQVASYNHGYDLVIDPVLVYSTYLGGSENDYGTGIAVDASGNAYITGGTGSTNFPLASPIKGTLGGFFDVFVTKIDSTGTILVYSTYLGGSSSDSGREIAVDSSGNAYIAGLTESNDFPLASPIQGTSGGGISDAFVTKIDPTGTNIIYSTYLGGSSSDVGHGIVVDSSGNTYVTGDTWSSDFPLASPIQGTYGGSQDAFVTKINTTGTSIVYSTYLGGSNNEEVWSIAVDPSGNAYIAGNTDSTDFPMVSPIQGTFGGGNEDAFVTKIDSVGTSLVYSTYLGGSDDDVGIGIAADPSGNAYITGGTDSTDFPMASPIQGTFGGGNEDAFVTKINTTGTSLVYSTYLGGSNDDAGLSIAVDPSGNAYITGDTDSTDFPMVSPIQGTHGGGTDAFVTKIDSVSTSLVYSTYLGGSDDDKGFGIVADPSGNTYITGFASSTDFPLASPIKETYGGNMYDAFVAKISDGSTSPTVNSTIPASSAVDVAINTNVTATFTEAMDSSTLSTSTFTLSDADGSINGTVSYNDETNTATFTPASVLAYTTTYTAMLSTGVTDSAGNNMASNHSWTFTTASGPDVTPSTVTSLSPVADAADVPINTTVAAIFSEAMDGSTINTSTFTFSDADGPIAGTVSYNEETKTATFTPASSLDYNTSYTAVVLTGMQDSAGNKLASTYSWTFTTKPKPDVIPPTVTSVSPVANATDVTINTTVTATFSEDMDSSTISTSTFTLSNANGNIAGSVSYNTANNRATFIPSANLSNSTLYTATITTAVIDNAANNMDADHTWSFTPIPSSGDSDGDGVPDNEDDNPGDATKASPPSTTGTGKISLDSSASAGTSLSNVQTISDSDPALNSTGKPTNYEFKDGLVSFKVNVVAPGDTITVDILFPTTLPANAKYYKVNSSGFHEFSGAVINGNTVTLTLTDGGSGDKDGVANSVIDDPGGIAVPVNTIPGQDNSNSGAENGGGCALNPQAEFDPILPLLIFSALLYWASRRCKSKE